MGSPSSNVYTCSLTNLSASASLVSVWIVSVWISSLVSSLVFVHCQVRRKPCLLSFQQNKKKNTNVDVLQNVSFLLARLRVVWCLFNVSKEWFASMNKIYFPWNTQVTPAGLHPWEVKFILCMTVGRNDIKTRLFFTIEIGYSHSDLLFSFVTWLLLPARWVERAKMKANLFCKTNLSAQPPWPLGALSAITALLLFCLCVSTILTGGEWGGDIMIPKTGNRLRQNKPVPKCLGSDPPGLKIWDRSEISELVADHVSLVQVFGGLG